jgi:DNA-binding NtrC family response regulator
MHACSESMRRAVHAMAQFLKNHVANAMQPLEMREFSTVRAKNSATLRILVVDDEPLIRWSLTETLSDCGYEVVERGDAAGARMAVADSGPFDVVLLDYRLPDSDDLSLLASIRDVAPGARIIMMTAFGRPEIIRGALELGAYSVISKPFEMEAIADLVAKAAGSAPETH